MNSPRLSVVMPVYNEAETVENAVEALLRQPLPWPWELVVVDDGSTDGTQALLTALASEPNLTFHAFPVNRGKGAAVRHGFSQARGEALLIFDADLEYHPGDIPRVAGPVLDEAVPVCFGSRFLNAAPPMNRFGLFNVLISRLTSLALDSPLSDMETCLKCFSRNLLGSMSLSADRFGIEPELTLEAARLTGAIREVPVRYMPRSKKEGKKIGFSDGLATLWWLWKGLARWRSGDAF